MHTFIELVRTYGWYILGGAKYTLILTLGGVTISLVLGLLLAFAGLSRHFYFRAPATFYIEIVRGTPILLHIFLIYFGLLVIGIQLSAVRSIIIAFGLNGAAYMAEIYRSGIAAVARDQLDSALALGMSYSLAMRRIVLPQTVPVILPNFANFLIATLKETSLALVIAVPEIMYRTYNVISYTYQSMSLLFIAAGAYLVVTLPLSRLVRVLERRASRALA